MNRSKTPVGIIAVAAALILLASCSRCALPFGRVGGAFTVAAYNVGSLFDPVDEGGEYPDFSVASGTWSAALYEERLLNTAEAIKACAPGGPDVIALEELENPRVLADINTALKKFGYAYAAMSVSGSAVNTGILSRLPIKRAFAHSLGGAENAEARNILEAEIDTGQASVFVIANHWKSKLGGAEETEPRRREAASLVTRRISTLRREAPSAYIIVLGDLNENADEWERAGGRYRTALMPAGSNAGSAGTATEGGDSLYLVGDAADFEDAPFPALFEPWFGKRGEGSYSYEGKWETIDHILLSPSFFEAGALRYDSFAPVKAAFLLDGKGIPLGWDTRKQKGYSDHLPVAVRITVSSD